MASQIVQRPLVPVSQAPDQFANAIGIDSAMTLPILKQRVQSSNLVHSLFESQVDKTPESIAIQYESEHGLTYAQLNSTANAVARQLPSIRGDIIAIATSRSPNLVIALLAVLKAGGSYVILSPDSPLDRNRYIIADTKAPFVITDKTTRGWFEPSAEVAIEQLVANSRTMSRKFQSDLNIYQGSEDSAYVIYTSGTTGQPKGVLLSHHAAYTGLAALPSLSSPQGFKQLLCHSPNFSAAQRTILGTLCRGGTLCLASKDNITIHLNETIQKMGISSLEITPSMLKLVDIATLPASVRKITLGGEAVGPALVEDWADRVELVSSYGLSEVTQLNLRHELKLGHSHQTIGKPTDSTTYHVLAPGSFELVPSESPGELCLGGEQLATRYLNLPKKTAEAFIQNPFGPGRLYRTGDLVKASADGTLSLIGRIDQQTKIDGQRVEPNESNSVIQLHPNVDKSYVVSATILGRKSLVALVVPKTESDWDILVRELRSILSKKLPSYAIPRYWAKREDLTLTVSGKIDIAALVKTVETLDAKSLITASSPSISRSNSPPLSENGGSADPRILSLIALVLNLPIPQIVLEASFQELGGSSLDAIVVSSHLRKINVSITVEAILQASTVAEILASAAESEHVEQTQVAPFSLLPQGIKLDRNGIEDAFPVTPLQEGILADAMRGGNNYVYQRVYRLQNTSPALLRDALQVVLSRSAILRTTFRPWKRSFLQLVQEKVSLPWRQVSSNNLQNFLKESQHIELPHNEPLVRATVVNEEFLVLEMHHGLFDWWSSQNAIEDTISILKGREPIPRASFNSYVAYQQRSYDEHTKQFWKEYLQSAPATVLDLQPNDKDEPFILKHDLGVHLEAFSHKHSVTLGTVLHAAWALTLAYTLKSTDVTFLTAFSGRDAELDGIISLDGPTLGIVPMRIFVDSSLSSVQFAKNVQSNLWSLSKYGHSGTRNALAAADVRGALFNTMVNVLVKPQEFPNDAPLLPVSIHGDNFTPNITIEINEVDPTTVKLLVPFGADHSIGKTLLERFVKFLQAMNENPEDFPNLKTQPDSQENLSTPAPSHHFGLAHSAFESFAITSPDKIALRTSNGRNLSYGELNRQANVFANWLISNGVVHGEMIPLYLEKSAETLISILGILKAGASFVPLDPANPQDRNAFIVKDIKALRLITDHLNKDTSVSFGVEAVILEDLDLSSGGEVNPKISELTPASVIYTIYTSGSTGLPKGVLVQHSAVTASTEGMIEATNVNSEWNALWVLNYVFDASYYDVFTLFSAGATINIAPQNDLLSNLAHYINELQIEQVMLTPTITKLISGGPSQVTGLKVLNVCGEKIDTNILHWAESIDVYNGYGPTEATILMTVSHVKPGSSLNSIGFPLKHAQALILPSEGGSLETVPHGTVGELCVKGPHLAKGYLNRPEQTAAAFIVDSDGEALYRTGDLARWDDDGTLECLGRKDYQIKINGFRVELGEIENAILHTEEVDAAIVSVAEVTGKRQLVAFVIFKGDHEPGPTTPLPSADRLDRVSALLPKLTTIAHYMLPSLFLPYKCLPTLPSGKANRKSLVASVEQMTKAEITEYLPHDGNVQEFVAVSTEEEFVMREAWCNVLDEPLDTIGATSVFLSLGGDSISAINVVAACRELNYTISVSHILSNPTLAEQATHLKAAVAKKTTADIKHNVPPIILTFLESSGISYEEEVEDIYPAGPGQTEFLIQGHKTQQFWNLTACRELPANFDLKHWIEVTTSLTAKNQILRSSYYKADQNDDSSWYQIIFKTPVLDLENIWYTTEAEKLQHMHALRDSLFQFGRPSLKYRILHSLETGARTLCIKVDHGTYDGTLLRVFDDQFKAFSRGETVPAVNSFKKFIDWNISTDKEDSLKYWKKSLDTYTPTHNLPLQPEADNLKFAPVTADVDNIAASFGVTASTVFQAAYSLVAARITGSNDVLVDNLLTGRNADVEDPQTLNGTCANFLPFRSQLSEAQSIEDLLKDTQAQFWDTTEHGTVGLTDIYKALGRDRQVHAAKIMYCFQPFEPAPPKKPEDVDHMRWIVMAQSKVFMSINYALMVEVQKTLGGHRYKLQWDSRALPVGDVDKFVELFNTVLVEIGKGKQGKVGALLEIDSDLASLWKA